jgi:hypothetical protein
MTTPSARPPPAKAVSSRSSVRLRSLSCGTVLTSPDHQESSVARPPARMTVVRRGPGSGAPPQSGHSVVHCPSRARQRIAEPVAVRVPFVCWDSTHRPMNRSK